VSDRPIDNVMARLAEHGPKPSGDSGRQWTCRCPAHEDREASLAVGLGDGDVVLLKCYAGCTTPQICAALGLEVKDLFPAREKRKRPPGATVNAIAFDKRLSDAWLRSFCQLTDGSWREKGVDHRAAMIPYFGVDGQLLFTRARIALSGNAGSRQPPGEKLKLYGLWLLGQFRERGGPLVFVEGESDCWALWSNEFNAIGVPGAKAETALKAADPAWFAGFERVCVWQEPDAAGRGFPDAVGAWLLAGGFTGRIDVASVAGAKDPADIHSRLGPGFAAEFTRILGATAPWQPPADAAGPATGVLPQQVQRVEAQLRKAGVCEWGEFDFTDRGNAARLEKLHGADLRFVVDRQQWYAWDGCRWAADRPEDAAARADATVLSLMLEAQLAPGRQGLDECVSWYTRSQSARSLEAVVRLARSIGRIPTRSANFDRQPLLLNCPNGVVELCTGRLVPHRREDMLTQMCSTPFDPTAKCPAWEQFLAAILPADRNDPAAGPNAAFVGFVQRLLGYCLTGETTVHMLPIFCGSGSNGKSTLLEVVQEVLGYDYAGPAPDGFLMAKHNEQHPADVADLCGKRLVVVSETKKGQRLDETLVKKLTGGDTLKARFMRENFFRFAATHKLIMSTNNRPNVPATDRGTWRRLALVPFDVSFWDPDKGETGPPHLKQDKDLKAKLLAETRGILAWMVRGCLEWKKGGLQQPEEVRDQTAAYRQEEDVFGRFLGDVYTSAPAEARVFVADVHAEFCRWCERNGERPNMTSRAISGEMRNRGYAVKLSTGGRTAAFGLTPIHCPTPDRDCVPY
jgi:putative DNA primase/helicase